MHPTFLFLTFLIFLSGGNSQEGCVNQCAQTVTYTTWPCCQYPTCMGYPKCQPVPGCGISCPTMRMASCTAGKGCYCFNVTGVLNRPLDIMPELEANKVQAMIRKQEEQRKHQYHPRNGTKRSEEEVCSNHCAQQTTFANPPCCAHNGCIGAPKCRYVQACAVSCPPTHAAKCQSGVGCSCLRV